MKRQSAQALQAPSLAVVQTVARPSGAITLSITLAPEAAATLIERLADAVAERIGGVQAPPALLDRSELARALGCSTASVDRLVRDGLPSVWLVESRRFELGAVLAWLRAHGKEPST